MLEVKSVQGNGTISVIDPRADRWNWFITPGMYTIAKPGEMPVKAPTEQPPAKKPPMYKVGDVVKLLRKEFGPSTTAVDVKVGGVYTIRSIDESGHLQLDGRPSGWVNAKDVGTREALQSWRHRARGQPESAPHHIVARHRRNGLPRGGSPR